VVEEERMSSLAFFFTAPSCFSFINAARCFSFLVMTAAFLFNPVGAAGMAFFFKAGVFTNPGGGLTSSFTAPEDDERRVNLPVFSSLNLCHLFGLIIFDGGGCTRGGEGERGVKRREACQYEGCVRGREGEREVERREVGVNATMPEW
jgi:hypothetical protein